MRNLSTTHLLDRLAHRLGEECYEVPVGFKHIVSSMLEHNALLGGESSGGLTIRGHILGKDGIFAAALVVEMAARTGRTISQLMEQTHAITGKLYSLEESLPATAEMRIVVPRRVNLFRFMRFLGRLRLLFSGSLPAQKQKSHSL